MENHELDKIIRQQLADREIKPSSMAWERLQNELEQTSQKRKPIQFWWIAAGVAFFFSLSVWQFYPSKEIPVVAPNSEIPTPQKLQTFENVNTPVVINNTTETNQNDTNYKKKHIALPVKKKHNVNLVQSNENNVDIAQTTQKENLPIDQKITEIAEIKTVNANEATALTLQYDVPKIEININEQDLLNQIQNDLQIKKSKNIRQKVIEVLKNKAEDIGIAIKN